MIRVTLADARQTISFLTTEAIARRLAAAVMAALMEFDKALQHNRATQLIADSQFAAPGSPWAAAPHSQHALLRAWH